MKYITFGRKKLLQHVIIWSILVLSNLILSPSNRSFKQDLISYILYYSSSIFIFYFLSFIVFQKLIGTNKILIVIIVIALFFIYTAIYYFNVNFIYPLFKIESKAQQFTIKQWLVDTFRVYFYICSAAWAFFFSHYNIAKIKEQNKHRKILLQRELNYLKKQFNTHLTFNFFNFCYSEVYQYSEKTANTIVAFTDMLGHSLQSSDNKKIPLANEINYIQNFISIQKLISTGIYVNLEVQGIFNEMAIKGRILSTLVERAFFYGITHDPDNPVEIGLIAENNKLLFNVSYKNKRKIIGSDDQKLEIEKVLKVLELFYKNRYNLTLSNNNGINKYNLELELK